MEYHEVLMKQVGVDCHGTFLNTGKFLAIQAAVAEKNQKRAHETHDAKQRASLEANALRDADLQDTLEHARQAEDELAKAAHNLTQSITKTAKNKGERDKLKGDIEDVHSLLRGSPRAPSPRGAKLVVHSLPDLAAFREVRSVAEYREYRDDLAVSRPAAAASSQTLELLEDYERDFELRYRGEVCHVPALPRVYCILYHLYLHLYATTGILTSYIRTVRGQPGEPLGRSVQQVLALARSLVSGYLHFPVCPSCV